MKTIDLLILILIGTNVFSQEIIKEIKSDVSEVTVFLEGAQVTRTKTLDIASGNSILNFVNLSPFIDAKSIQFKINGEINVLAINFQQNYGNGENHSEEIQILQSRIIKIDEQIEIENTYLSIINEELQFLQGIKTIGTKESELDINNFKLASDFYGEKLKVYKLDEVKRRNVVKTLNAEKYSIQQKISSLSNVAVNPKGEVLVKIKSKSDTKARIVLTYLVGNAGWYPSYDIKAREINQPVELSYKANVHQDTHEDWTDIKLSLSTANPKISGVIPSLLPYILDYNSLPVNYSKVITQVSGKIMDTGNEPLPGVNIMVKGTTIGTISDVNGNYSITVPSNSSALMFSYLGYLTEEKQVNNEVMNVRLVEDIVALNEVVVVGYGTMKKSDLTGAVSSVSVRGLENSKDKTIVNTPLPTNKRVNQTTVDFTIDIPYTIHSDNKNYTVDMVQYNLPASFQYFAIPKVSKEVFLLAHITDWEKYSLQEGEANIFFEDTYIGKTILDVSSISDTLKISLGRDKGVTIQREKQKDLLTKSFIGGKKEETKSWLISVRNNKNQPISMVVLDQRPISLLEEIEVAVLNISDGIEDSKTGEIKWEFNLPPTDKKEFELRYAVKYPKNKTLIVE